MTESDGEWVECDESKHDVDGQDGVKNEKPSRHNMSTGEALRLLKILQAQILNPSSALGSADLRVTTETLQKENEQLKLRLEDETRLRASVEQDLKDSRARCSTIEQDLKDRESRSLTMQLTLEEKQTESAAAQEKLKISLSAETKTQAELEAARLNMSDLHRQYVELGIKLKTEKQQTKESQESAFWWQCKAENLVLMWSGYGRRQAYDDADSYSYLFPVRRYLV